MNKGMSFGDILLICFTAVVVALVLCMFFNLSFIYGTIIYWSIVIPIAVWDVSRIKHER